MTGDTLRGPGSLPPSACAARRPFRGFRAAATAGLLLVLGTAACSATGVPPRQAARPSPSPTSAPAAAAPLALQVTPAPYQLPAGVAREVVLPVGQDLLIAGGLTSSGTTTDAAA